jgi:hypothetical protein
VKGSKTLSSYNANVYTDDFIKFTSEDAKNSTLKNLNIVHQMDYPCHLKSGYSTKPKENKKIMINYYSDSENLMFGFESCKS